VLASRPRKMSLRMSEPNKNGKNLQTPRWPKYLKTVEDNREEEENTVLILDDIGAQLRRSAGAEKQLGQSSTKS